MKKPEKILIVDDDAEDRDFLIETINELYPKSNNVTADNGKEALDYIANYPPPPPLIFLDLNMPFVNGFEFLVAYKKNPQHINSHVIIYTTSSNSRDKAVTKDLGASAFITKVGDTKLLKKNIQEVVEKFI
jgi:CheY-like chemotaxis protein